MNLMIKYSMAENELRLIFIFLIYEQRGAGVVEFTMVLQIVYNLFIDNRLRI